MTPTPAQLSRLLALPFVAHQRLVEQEGAGWWCQPGAHPMAVTPYPAWNAGRDRAWRIEHGWAWLPTDSAALMRAATPEGGWWSASYDARGVEHWMICRGPTGAPDDDGDCLAADNTALDCALMALEATS